MNLCELQQCNICLKNCQSTVTLQDSDETDIKWFTKLQFTIPELEWLEEFIICESCRKQLQKAWEFKRLVLNLETERRLGLTKKELYYEENNDFRNSCDTTDYFVREETEIACDICSKIFTTETQLRQHALQNHSEPNEDTTSCKVEDLFTCYDCSIGFSTKTNLLYHVVNDHGKVEACLICNKVCSNRVAMKNHIKYDHGIETQSEYNSSNCSGILELDNKLNEQCRSCKERFSSINDLNAHLRLCGDQIEDSKSMYKSGTCNHTDVIEKDLNLHKVWCSNEGNGDGSPPIKCDSSEEYKEHDLLKHESEPIDSQPSPKKRRGRKPFKLFTCEICSRQFEYVKLVVAHCISEHNMAKKSVKPYTCEQCEMRFATSANLDQHRHYHNQNRSNVCSLCGKGFKTKSDLTVHEYTHYNRRNYKCSKCDKAFNTNKNLRTHILVVHTDRSLWKYGCSICEKRFALKTNYEQHLRRHTGEKKYVCHICTKPFISKTEMKRHIKLHSNIKAFKCNVCNKEYKERRTHEMHLTKAHGIGNAKITVREKKFVCHICPSQFYDKQKLSKHLCSHSGLKPFSCDACDKKFTDKWYVKHHLKTVHNIESPGFVG